MKQNLDYSLILGKLKEIIKQKNFTYKDISGQLNLSESGLKKFFASQNPSLMQLLKICEIIRVPFSYIVTSSNETDSEWLDMNEEQEELLLYDWDLFCFYFLLNGANTIDQIKENYFLSDIKVEKFLLALDKVNLIKYHSRDKIDNLRGLSTKWKLKGSLTQKMLTNFSNRIIEEGLFQNNSSNFLSEFRTFRLSSLNYTKFSKKIRDFLYELDNLTTREFLEGKEMEYFSLLIAFPSRSFVEKSDIPSVVFEK